MLINEIKIKDIKFCGYFVYAQGSRKRIVLRKSTHIYCQVTCNNYQLGVPAYANFPKLYHPSITILSAAVSVYYIFDTRPLCINFDTHLIEYVNYLLTVISVRCR